MVEDLRKAYFYYVFKVEVISCKGVKISCKTNYLNSVNANDSFSPHSPRVVLEEWILKNII
jgi:hypothetical protein